MLEPFELTLTVLIGGTYDETITLYQDAAMTQPYLMPSGYSATLVSDDGQINLSSAGGTLILNPTSGAIRILIGRTVTSTLKTGQSHYHIAIDDGAGDTQFPVAGIIRYRRP
jgi:hypothetical protein